MTSIYLMEPGLKLATKGGHFVLSRGESILTEVPILAVRDITLRPNIQISANVIKTALQENIPVSWLSTTGRSDGLLLNHNFFNVILHQMQFESINNNEFAIPLSKSIVEAKINNQIILLSREKRKSQPKNVVNKLEKALKNMKISKRKLKHAKTKEKIMGYEGYASKLYFSAFSKLFPKEFKFNKRTKKPPKDPVNAALSYGYSMLHKEIISNIIAVGLHPYVSILHSLRNHHPALASDLIEEWRIPLVDQLILKLFSHKTLKADNFVSNGTGCYLNHVGRKILLLNYEKRMEEKNNYIRNKLTFREGIKHQITSYATAIRYQDPVYYSPLRIR